MIVEMPLTQGKVARVSDENPRYAEASRHKWTASWSGSKWYAHRKSPRNKTVYLHRFLADAPDGYEVDHKDGDGLNCTDDNLRICTHSQNNCNRQKQPNNTSGFVGVVWHKKAKKWMATVKKDGHTRYLGLFNDPEDAARVRDAVALGLHGEFSVTNF